MTTTYKVMIETTTRKTHGRGLQPTITKVFKAFATAQTRQAAEAALAHLDKSGNGYIEETV